MHRQDGRAHRNTIPAINIAIPKIPATNIAFYQCMYVLTEGIVDIKGDASTGQGGNIERGG